MIERVRRLRAETREVLRRHRRRRQLMARSARWPFWQLFPGRITAPPDLRGDVLRVVQEHPEGIRAVDVGNELGVDWRLVLGVGRALTERGLIDQVDHDLYPIPKAGPTC